MNLSIGGSEGSGGGVALESLSEDTLLLIGSGPPKRDAPRARPDANVESSA
jgi:hypothetical protein